ncbi:HEAT repeat domain-containing protein [Streptomyces sp. NBC_01294]|uniref:HEAT repeat domain-containing protein n=1 Tax=Streptomyces sp. NBC_01294 TaxID=2903815 RepID=UPI002DDB0158|nr:hypothetical protein [Streptomyces sp. NBC_01294]WRZ60707.1 hypothetical protein OG534_32000 [Streptomyces sp. NBC_01294]
MDVYQRLTAVIESAWQELTAADTRRRDHCLEVISDVLETGRLTQDDAERAVERLVQVALSDEGHTLRESALHAIFTASTPYQLPYRVVEPLADGVDRFEPVLLGYVLGILCDTYDRAALPIIERFLDHPHPEVRREAAEAVSELSKLSAAAGRGPG